jgi:hypothetical protein
MRNAFVFIVWDDYDRWESKIRAELARESYYGVTGHALIKKLDGIVYAFGEKCAEAVRSYGIEPITMSDDSPYTTMKMGQWRKRYIALQDAFEKHDQVVSMDIDCVMVQDDLPSDFWGRLANGKSMQYPLVGPYSTHIKTPWRPEDGYKFNTTSCWFYLRERRRVTDMLQVMDEHHGEWDDEIGASWLIDQEMGGWQGPNAYRAAGYDPSFVRVRYGHPYHPTPFVHLEK